MASSASWRRGAGVSATRSTGTAVRRFEHSQPRPVAEESAGVVSSSMSILRFRLLCALLSAGCGGGSDEPAFGSTPGSARTSATAGESPAAVAEPGAPCPRTGRWAACSLEKRLEQSGFVPRKEPGAQPSRRGFGVPPIVYALGPARLEVFIYTDESALRRDVAGMDTALAAPRGQTNDWEIATPFRAVRKSRRCVSHTKRTAGRAPDAGNHGRSAAA